MNLKPRKKGNFQAKSKGKTVSIELIPRVAAPAAAVELELDVAAPKIVTSSIRSSVFRPQYHPNPAAYPETKPIAWKEVHTGWPIWSQTWVVGLT